MKVNIYLPQHYVFEAQRCVYLLLRYVLVCACAALWIHTGGASRSYRAIGCEKQAAAAIRKAIRQTMGAQAVRELPRCQYEIVMKQVAMWDDYKTMKRIKNKGVVV